MDRNEHREILKKGLCVIGKSVAGQKPHFCVSGMNLALTNMAETSVLGVRDEPRPNYHVDLDEHRATLYLHRLDFWTARPLDRSGCGRTLRGPMG
ncbi:hypothetical protein J6590_081936 [Homalodisca vitripennis]|nr:hypothetical protein J6590_081936 [Homalodisca vitripennis]